jgi:hypothetical protein
MDADKSQEMLAAIDLIHRAGGTDFFLGHDSDPVVWWVTATFKDEEITERDESLDVAAMKLARRLMSGAICMYCRRSVTIDRSVYGSCNWTRLEDKFVPECRKKKLRTAPTNRAERRAEAKEMRRRK